MAVTTKGLASLQFANRLFTQGTGCFGHEEILKAFGTELSFLVAEQVPPIPFSEEELIRARTLGQFLILCGPVSMSQINAILGGELNKKKLLYDNSLYKDKFFYTSELREWHWRLTTHKVIPGSMGLNYLEQTQVLAQYLQEQVYAEQEMPEIYTRAIEELKDCETALAKLIVSNDQQKATEQLADMMINRYCRETPGQVLWSTTMFNLIDSEYMLPGMYTWTSQRFSDNELVYVGYVGWTGVGVGRDFPRCSNTLIGVRFSRSAVPP